MAGERRVHAYLHPDVLYALVEIVTQGRIRRPQNADEFAAWHMATTGKTFWPARSLGVFSSTHSSICTAVHEEYRYEGKPTQHRWRPLNDGVFLPYPAMCPRGMSSLDELLEWRRENEAPRLMESAETVARTAGIYPH